MAAKKSAHDRRCEAFGEHVIVITRLVTNAFERAGVGRHLWQMSGRPFGFTYLLGSEQRQCLLDPAWGESAVRKHVAKLAYLCGAWWLWSGSKIT